MTADAIWNLVLKIGTPLASAGLLALLGWWVKNQAQKTLFQKALSQFASLAQGFASDVTSGMSQAISDATADGTVTPAERAILVTKLVSLMKTSGPARLLSTLEGLLGLESGSAFDTWLRGMAGEHIDAQLTSPSPVSRTSALVATQAGTPAVAAPVPR